jgi:hypothetical protein
VDDAYCAELQRKGGASLMADIVVIVLGTGAILLMAAYAVLCERI